MKSKQAMQGRQAKKRTACITSVVLAVVLALVATPVIVAMAAPVTPTIKWYTEHQTDSSYTLANPGQLAGLAQLVNGTADFDEDGNADPAVSFEGKTIYLSNNANYIGNTITPIGTSEHPFLGTFDGQGNSLRSFVIGEEYAGSTNIGFFGYVGTGGCVKNVVVDGSSSITLTRGADSNEVLENIGMLVGFCGGTIENCSVLGNNFINDTIVIDTAVLQQSAEQTSVVRNVGGVVGQCIYDVKNCSFSGTVDVSATSTPVTAFEWEYLVSNVGGVAGYLGDISKQGTSVTPIPTTPDQHGSMTGCANTGMIRVDTPAANGVDRFGVAVQARSENVGGVVGYTQGSVYSCINGDTTGMLAGTDLRNTGYVRAENASPMGGVVGAMRVNQSPNYSSAGGDDGSEADPIVLRDCTNTGDLYGLAATGGIVGSAGSYTTVTGCLNMNKTDQYDNPMPSYVIATRWNKPAPAGIAGRSNGIVSYCANFANVASGTYKDGGEAARSFTYGAGYYASGICGMLTYHMKEVNGEMLRSTPIPEVFGCYNAGSVFAVSGMRQRGITGNNEGFTHDNVLLKGTVDNDKIVYGDDPADTEAAGTCAHNTVMDNTASQEMASLKSAEAVAWLNTQSDATGWDTYWVLSKDGLNNGYPVLNTQATWSGSSITAATVTLEANAEYSGSESVPQLKVVLGGQTLVQNADYKVLPQTGAIEVSTGAPYKASVVGLGDYEGLISPAASYDIVKGDLNNCTVTVESKEFNYAQQTITSDEVVVTTPNGSLIDPSEYDVSFVEASVINAGLYHVNVVAKDSSTHFYGQKGSADKDKPIFVLKTVSLMNKVTKTTISYLGQDYTWVSSVDDQSTNPQTTLPYAGGTPVKPTVNAVTYTVGGTEHTLVEGQDYRIIYGNPSADDGSGESNDNYNVGTEGGSTIGCVTIRDVAGANFGNYDNMFFYITDSGQKPDIAKATIEAPDVVFDGKEKTPVVVKYGAATLVEGSDYSIVYQDNVRVGTASFTITGTGSYQGSTSGTFNIVEGSLYDIIYSYSGTGTSADPYVASVTGAIYHGSEELFDLFIPDTIEHEGVTYTVTSIADKAFGGPGNGDFVGSPENTTKTKVGTVSIPATVTTLGDYAFGSASNNQQSNVTQVTFREGSLLETIGAGAFQKAKGLESISLPAGVQTIGTTAFRDCSSLADITFETASATLPSNIAANAFTNVSGTVVHGQQSATAVKTLATSNAGNSTGANGGKKFTFEATAGAIADASIEAIGDQDYTGLPLTPAPVVKLAGKTLVSGTDYRVEYQNNVSIGQASYTIIGMGSYFGSKSGNFNIIVGSLDRAVISGIEKSYGYTGSAIEPQPTVTLGATQLLPGTDYRVEYQNNTSVGKASYTVIGMGLYVGTKTGNFDIVVRDLSRAVISGVKPSYEYTGSPIKPQPTVSYDGKKLVLDTDYTLSYSANTNKGQATISINAVQAQGFTGSAQKNFAITAVVTRLAGPIALDTMEAITQEAFADDSCNSAIVATLDSFVDALTASGLAGLENCPILLTNQASLSPQTARELKRLGAEKVYIAGGTMSVSTHVEDQIKALSTKPSVQRAAGLNGVDTARKVYEAGKGSWGDTAIVATEYTFQDALSIAPYAYAKNAPIFLSSATTHILDDATVQAIRNGGFSRVIICGGTASISNQVEKQLAGISVKRLGGETCYDTSNLIAAFCVQEGMEASGMAVATGESYYDALAGAPLCGTNNAPLMLISDQNRSCLNSFVKPNKNQINQAYVFGGTASVSETTYKKLVEAIG